MLNLALQKQDVSSNVRRVNTAAYVRSSRALFQPDDHLVFLNGDESLSELGDLAELSSLSREPVHTSTPLPRVLVEDGGTRDGAVDHLPGEFWAIEQDITDYF